METTFKKVSEIIENKEYCPIPLNVIPNNMGINLCSVDAISWQKQNDGQLVNLTIHFLPNEHMSNDNSLLPSVEKAGEIAVTISESVKPKLSAQEQSFFISGFQECIKWLFKKDYK